MNTTEYAAKIRKELKEKHGWNSRQVSVRADYYSMGSSIHVEIKDASIPLGVVKEIAEQAERISRCEVTGEILGGGHRFVEVRYSREAEEAIAADLAKNDHDELGATFENVDEGWCVHDPKRWLEAVTNFEEVLS